MYKKSTLLHVTGRLPQIYLHVHFVFEGGAVLQIRRGRGNKDKLGILFLFFFVVT